MTKVYEFLGRNVEKALQKASDELNIPLDKIKHEVLAYGSTGIFGLVGVKKAKIKVFVEEEDQEKKPRVKSDDTKSMSTVEADLEEDIEKSDLTDEGMHDEELVNSGIQSLQKIADGITLGTTVHLDKKKGKLIFSISGGESGVLIGKRGQTLEAIQYLLEKMINKKSTNRVRVLVDVEGYLTKRKKNLQEMASRMAEKAKRSNKPVTIGQMNSHDRRIVHIHLKNENDVRTQSIGEGYYRKLMVFPKKQSGIKQKNSQTKT